MSVNDLMKRRAEKLTKVQKYLFERIEELNAYHHEHFRKGKDDTWIANQEIDAETLAVIACNVAIVEELKEIEKLCITT